MKSDPLGTKSRGRVAFAAGDALRLPFKDGAFDAVTISFGLRNVEDSLGALAEMHRVTRPGGVLVVCEFSTPTWPPFCSPPARRSSGPSWAFSRNGARWRPRMSGC